MRGAPCFTMWTSAARLAWKKAWKIACQSARVRCRWHDCRHTFITRLAKNPNVSEETIRALAGHVSKKMLERYSHIRLAAKEAAIADLERPASTLTILQLARSADVLDRSPEVPQSLAGTADQLGFDNRSAGRHCQAISGLTDRSASQRRRRF